MMSRLALMVVMLVFSPAMAGEQKPRVFEAGPVNNTSFTYGEKLTYKVSYSLYFNLNVGEVTFEIADKPREIAGENHYHIVSHGRTYPFYDRFFKVRDRHESFLNVETLLPRIFIRDIHEGGYESYDFVVFDHFEGTANKDNEKEIDITEFTHDMVSVLYFARNFDFENANPGDSFKVDTYLSGEVYEVGAIYEGIQEVTTSKGTFECLILRPILIAGRVFESETGMMLYVTNDSNRIPVKIESGISVGSISATLEKAENLRHPMTSQLN